jgi:hypothetical protein
VQAGIGAAEGRRQGLNPFDDFAIGSSTTPEQRDVANIAGTLTTSVQFGATKIANFSALSEVLWVLRARLTTNRQPVSHPRRQR